MTNEVSVDAVVDIVKSVFSTMMELDVTAVENPNPPTGSRLTASVFLEGEWKGAVSVVCNTQQACIFAGRFLAMDPPEEIDADVCDAFGELANMIGGNIKSSLGKDTRLSMPSVIAGSDYELRVCGSEVQSSVAFIFEGGTFWVKILGGDRPPGGNRQSERSHS